MLPPGKRHTEGSVAASASARSILIPFSLPRNVGGNNENKPKFTVFPAEDAPSNTTLNTLFTSAAELVGFSWKVNFFHSLVTPLICADAKVWPRVDLSETVMAPGEDAAFA